MILYDSEGKGVGLAEIERDGDGAVRLNRYWCGTLVESIWCAGFAEAVKKRAALIERQAMKAGRM